MNTTIDKNLHDILNAGFGLFRTFTIRFEDTRKGIEKGYQELVARGAADKGEFVQQLRGGVDRGITTVRDASVRLEGMLKGTRKV